ncbi:T9SS type A sorting domain-containing protein [Polaribacter sp.]|nr:T9SS type A sorting domain-containing protein [Polaribacter sp.]
MNFLRKTTFVVCVLTVSQLFTQILTVSNGASISVENTASINLGGLTLAPSNTFVISGTKAVSITNTPVGAGSEDNTSINRVYDATTALSGFTGTIIFAYEESELNGIAESDLTLETQSADGVWSSHPANVDATNNTLSYVFADTLEFMRITASSLNANLTVEEMAANDFVKVYPNPTTDKLIIVSKSLQKSILYNVNGQKVLESNRNELTVSELPIGVYFLHTTNAQNQLITFKVIKK